MKDLLLSITIISVLVSCNSVNKPKNFAKNEFKQWVQTPPMGWNSWDCYGPTVREDEVKANTDFMAEKLKPYGWEYIVVDIRWFVENDVSRAYNQKDPIYHIDEWGRYLPAPNRFPSAINGSFKELGEYIHNKGLKFGIHIMRGIPKLAVERKLPILGANGVTADQIYSTEMQCKWLKDNYTIVADRPGAQEYYNSIFDMYAEWGVDFVKVDDISRPYHKAEVELIRNAIDQCGRPMVLSLSPGEMPVEEAAHVAEHANMWRMVDDMWDRWDHLAHLIDVAQRWYPHIKEGTWPDCDMIPLGTLTVRGERSGPKPRKTNFTEDEQYTLFTFFTMLRSPLMFGGDLPRTDESTIAMLNNKDVLKMHREATEVQQLFRKDNRVSITSRNPNSGEVYLAFINIDNEKTQDISVNINQLGLNGNYKTVNMWTGEEIAITSDTFTQTIRPHASGLYKFIK